MASKTVKLTFKLKRIQEKKEGKNHGMEVKKGKKKTEG